MVVGMVIVYIFLIVLMLSVIISARLFKDSDPPSLSKGGSSRKSRKNIVPVIAAAVAAHKARGG